MRIRNLIVLSLCLTLCSCVTVLPKDYTAFNSAQLRSILIVPPTNLSTDVDAPDYFLTTIAIPVAEQGYYVFPVNLAKRLLEDDGLNDANLVHQAPTERLSRLFGADAVLYISIDQWNAKYLVFSTTVTVSLTYVIRDGRDGQELWRERRVVQYTPQNSSSGNIAADLVAGMITAAVTKAAPNYLPLARQANWEAVKYPGPGFPPGPYLGEE